MKVTDTLQQKQNKTETAPLLTIAEFPSKGYVAELQGKITLMGKYMVSYF